ncbi:MAG: hypothetical protein SFY32_13155 [Bacteroidota bacterium]|nr:hypothetical protein [Bacteroidota bacterium]
MANKYLIICPLFINILSFSQSDSILIHLKSDNDSLIKSINNPYKRKSDVLYDRIGDISKKSKITYLVYKNLFREPDFQFNESVEYIEPQLIYTKYNGKIIKAIKIYNYKPFGTSVIDTSKSPTLSIDKTGNVLHIKTHKKLIQSITKLKEGDVFDASKVYNAERVLRTTTYLLDSRIYVFENQDLDGIEIHIFTQDIWPWGADAGLDVVKSSPIIFPYIAYSPEVNYAWVQNNNMLGLGHQFRYTTFLQNNQYQGFTSNYTIPYIGKSLVRISLDASYLTYSERYSGNLSRGFVLPTTRYAWGILYFYDKSDNLLLGTGTGKRIFEYNYIDTWFGRSIKLSNLKTQQRFVFSVRQFTTHFNNTIGKDKDTNQLFQDKHTGLLGVGYSNRSYYRDLYIYGFGRTEDVPKGLSVAFVGGIEYSAFGNRPYTGFSYSQGYFYKNFGYLFMRTAFGTYFNNNDMQQGAFNSGLNYFTRLFSFGKIRMRQFVKLDYVYGINRKEVEQLYINDGLGVRGYFNNSAIGSQRFVVNLETVFYTPWEFGGFKFAPFLFYDFAWLSKSQYFQDFSNSHQGVGLGFRFRNERLAFNTFQIRLAYYPNLNANDPQRLYNISSIPFYNLSDFDINAPSIVVYR